MESSHIERGERYSRGKEFTYSERGEKESAYIYIYKGKEEREERQNGH